MEGRERVVRTVGSYAKCNIPGTDYTPLGTTLRPSIHPQSGTFAPPLQRLSLKRSIVAEACEPVHLRLAPKPAELALCVAARGLLNRGTGLVHRDTALQYLTQFAVTDKIEWLRVFG